MEGVWASGNFTIVLFLEVQSCLGLSGLSLLNIDAYTRLKVVTVCQDLALCSAERRIVMDALQADPSRIRLTHQGAALDCGGVWYLRLPCCDCVCVRTRLRATRSAGVWWKPCRRTPVAYWQNTTPLTRPAIDCSDDCSAVNMHSICLATGSASRHACDTLALVFNVIFWVGEQCLQCFDAVGWAAGRASGL